MGVIENKAAVERLFDGKRLEFDEMLFLTFNDSGQVVHQRGIVDNLAGLRQAGVIPTPSNTSEAGPDGE